jgi:hypothetical protein
MIKQILLIVIALLLFSACVEARDSWRIYRSYTTVTNELFSLEAKYPTLVSHETIGKTLQGKNIYMFRVGNSSGGKFMFDGRIHGPEDCGTENGVAFIKWVLTNGSSDANSIKTKNYLLFIPGINIDSVARQNMRRNYTINGVVTKVLYGVDLNRNFVSGWGETGSGNPTNNYEYRGISAGSEPETQAVRNAMLKYKPAIYMNVHCGMQMLRYTNYDTPTKNTIANISYYASKYKQPTMSYYPPIKGCYGGYVCKDGDVIGGTGWIHESSEWGPLPSTLSGYLSTIYPRVFPIYLGMARSVQK